jgi:hypothetical protein
MGFTEEEFDGVDPQIKTIFTLNNASDTEILRYRIDQAIRKFQQHPLDTASYAVRSKKFCLTNPSRLCQRTNHSQGQIFLQDQKTRHVPIQADPNAA